MWNSFNFPSIEVINLSKINSEYSCRLKIKLTVYDELCTLASKRVIFDDIIDRRESYTGLILADGLSIYSDIIIYETLFFKIYINWDGQIQFNNISNIPFSFKIKSNSNIHLMDGLRIESLFVKLKNSTIQINGLVDIKNLNIWTMETYFNSFNLNKDILVVKNLQLHKGFLVNGLKLKIEDNGSIILDNSTFLNEYKCLIGENSQIVSYGLFENKNIIKGTNYSINGNNIINHKDIIADSLDFIINGYMYNYGKLQSNQRITMNGNGKFCHYGDKFCARNILIDTNEFHNYSKITLNKSDSIVFGGNITNWYNHRGAYIEAEYLTFKPFNQRLIDICNENFHVIDDLINAMVGKYRFLYPEKIGHDNPIPGIKGIRNKGYMKIVSLINYNLFFVNKHILDCVKIISRGESFIIGRNGSLKVTVDANISVIKFQNMGQIFFENCLRGNFGILYIHGLMIIRKELDLAAYTLSICNNANFRSEGISKLSIRNINNFSDVYFKEIKSTHETYIINRGNFIIDDGSKSSIFHKSVLDNYQKFSVGKISNLELEKISNQYNAKLYLNGKINITKEYINHGEVVSSGSLTIETFYCNHDNGKTQANDIINLITNNFSNKNGKFYGINGTQIKILNTFDNQNGIIGLKGKTKFFIEKNIIIDQLGTIYGDKVKINTPINSPKFILRNGNIFGKIWVVIFGKYLECPNVNFTTNKLKLFAIEGFKLYDQSECKRTIIFHEKGISFNINNPYNTKGTFEIQQFHINNEILSENNIELSSQPVKLPSINILTKIKADSGIKICSSNKLNIGNYQIKGKIISNNGTFEIYVSLFDIINGGGVADKIKITGKFGITVGRLIHNKTCYSIAENVGHDIFNVYCLALGKVFITERNRKLYNINKIEFNEFLKKNNGNLFTEIEPKLYDGNNFNCPVGISNGGFLIAKDTINLIGSLNLCGNLESENLILTSSKDHNCIASSIQTQNLQLNGLGKLHLYMGIGELYFGLKIYISDKKCNKWCHRVDWRHWRYPSTDPTSMFVTGTVICDPNSGIVNHSSNLHLNNSRNISITDDIFVSSFTPLYKGITQKFQRNQLIYHSINSFIEDTVINSNTLQGNISASGSILVIPVGNNNLILGNSKSNCISQIGSIHDLCNDVFNDNITYITPDFPQFTYTNTDVSSLNRNIGGLLLNNYNENMIDVTRSKFYFSIREKYWFDDNASQEFYQSISSDIFIIMPNGSYKKAENNCIFNLSPKYLLNQIRNKCMNILKRGYIEDNKPINEIYIKELHRNTTNHLLSQDNKLVITGSVILNANIPMILYKESLNLHNQKEYKPILYVPQTIINKIKSRQGSLININKLCVLPNNVKLNQIITTLKDRPENQKQIRNFVQSNQLALEYINNDNIISSQENDNKSSSNVRLYGSFNVNDLCIINPGSIISHADIESRQILLSSISSDVIMQSCITRKYSDSLGSFNDFISSKSRASAQSNLNIFGRNFISEGAESYSGNSTYIEASGDIYRIPISLTNQKVEIYGKKKKKTTSYKISTTQVIDTNTSGGSITERADGKIILIAPHYKAGNIIDSQATGPISVQETHDIWELNSTTTSKKHLRGRKTIINQSAVTKSKGAIFDAPNKIILGSQQSNIDSQNVSFLSSLSQLIAQNGYVSLTLGINSEKSYINKFRSSKLWIRRNQTYDENIIFSIPRIIGKVEINSPTLYLQNIKNKHLPYYSSIIPHSDIQSNFKIHNQIANETHIHKKQIQRGPSVGLSALINLVISMTTDGILNNQILSAGFSSLCSHTSISLLSNNFNTTRTLKSITNIQTLKSISIAMINKAAMIKVCEYFKLPDKFIAKTPTQHFIEKGSNALINACLNIGILNQKIYKSLKEGFTQTITDSIGAICSTKIGKIKGNVGLIMHKILHMVSSGFIKGILANKRNKLREAFSSAMGAGLSETLAELLTDKFESDPKILNRNVNLSCLITSIFALFLNLNVETTISASFNALHNNFMITMTENTQDKIIGENALQTLTKWEEEIKAEQLRRDNPNISWYEWLLSHYLEHYMQNIYNDFANTVQLMIAFDESSKTISLYNGGKIDNIIFLYSLAVVLGSIMLYMPSAENYSNKRQITRHKSVMNPTGQFSSILKSGKNYSNKRQVAMYKSVKKGKVPFVMNPEISMHPTGQFSGILKSGPIFSRKFFKDNLSYWNYNPRAPYVVFTHGTPFQVFLSGYSNREYIFYGSHKKLATIIKSQKAYKKGNSVVLFSCNTGKDKNGIAQLLANELDDIVHAPDDYIHLGPFGWISIGEDAGPFRELRTFYPNKKDQ